MIALAVLCAAAGLALAEQRDPGGWGNNADHPEWGAANGSALVFAAVPAAAAAADADRRPGPRNVSLNVFGARPNPASSVDLSVATAAWGQFLAHDMLWTYANDSEPAPITVPACDPFLDPSCHGDVTIAFTRSARSEGGAPLSQCSHYVDASPVYGCSLQRENAVREFAGGRLLEGDDYGDPRAPESALLLAVTRLLRREHNRRAALLAGLGGDEEIFQAAKAQTISVVQGITMREYLPALTGQVLPYLGYDAAVDASVDVLFATVAMRYGHSAVPPVLPRYTPEYEPHEAGPMLFEEFHYDHQVLDETSLGGFLRGLVVTRENHIDAVLSPNLQRRAPDMGALNVARGRDHRVPSIAAVQAALGTPVAGSIAELAGHDEELQRRLEAVYGADGIDLVDAYVGALAEEVPAGAALGPTLAASLLEQFNRSMHGDRFWSPSSALSLGDLLLNNTDSLAEYATASAFVVSDSCPASASCSGADEDSSFSVALSTDVVLSWTVVDDSELQLELVIANVDGDGEFWGGVGFGPNMGDGDLYVGSTLSGAVSDGYTTDYSFVVDSGDIAGSQVALEDGVFTVAFSRPLQTTESTDKSVIEGLTDVLWAHSNGGGSVGYHASNRGQHRINFFTGESQSVSISSVYLLHGVVMGLAWGLAAPCGIYIARYCKTLELIGGFNWLVAHKELQKLGAAGALPLALVAITARESTTRILHGTIGIALVAVLFLQAGLGIASASLLGTASYSAHVRRGVGQLHVVLGYPLLWAGVFNCYLGLQRLLNEEHHALLDRLFVAYVALWVVIVGVTELLRWRSNRRTHAMSDSPVADLTGATSRLTPLTHRDIKDRTIAGANLVIVDGLVCDVQTWLRSHPGGSKVIFDALGQDISTLFRGSKEGRRLSMARHVHSSAAWLKLRELAVGRVVTEDGEPEEQRAQAQALDQSYSMWVVQGRERLTVDGASAPVDLFTLMPVFSLGRPRPLPGSAYLWFSAPPDQARVEKPYTPVVASSTRRISVSPSGEQPLQFAVKLYPDGLLGQRLNALKQGNTVSLRGPVQYSQPLGSRARALLPDLAQASTVSCIVAGSGLTPALHLFEWIAHHGMWGGKVRAATLVFAVRKREDLFLQDVIEHLVEGSEGRLQVHFSVSSEPESGRLTAEKLGPLLARIAAVPPADEEVKTVHRSGSSLWRRLQSSSSSVTPTLPPLEVPSDADQHKEDEVRSGGGIGRSVSKLGKRLTSHFHSPTAEPPAEEEEEEEAEEQEVGKRSELFVVCGPAQFNQAMFEALQTPEVGVAEGDVVLL